MVAGVPHDLKAAVRAEAALRGLTLSRFCLDVLRAELERVGLADVADEEDGQ